MISHDQLDALERGFKALEEMSLEYVTASEEHRKLLKPLIMQAEVACAMAVRIFWDRLRDAAEAGLRAAEEANKPPPAGAPYTALEGFHVARDALGRILRRAQRDLAAEEGDCGHDTQRHAHTCGATVALMWAMSELGELTRTPHLIEDEAEHRRLAQLNRNGELN